MTRMMMSWMCGGLLVAGVAMAEEPEPQPEEVYAQETFVDFVNGVRVEGKLYKPTGKLVLTRRATTFPPLVKLRDNFRVESRRSVDAVK